MKNLPLLVLLVSLTPVAGCTSDAGAEDVSSVVESGVTEGVFTDHILLTGEIEAAVADTVSVPRLPSWQTTLKWLAEEGALVNEGERVAELDTASFASDLDSKIEARSEAEEKLRQYTEETRAEIGEKEFDYLRRIKEHDVAKMNAGVPKEIVSLKEYEERQLAYERAKTELEKAKTLLEATRKSRAAEQQNLQLDLDEKRRQISIAERAIETMTLHAPSSGVFVLNEHPWFGGRKLEVGDNVWVGFPIAQIPDLSTLQVSAELFDVDDGRVKTGMPAKVVIDAFPGRTFDGTVNRVSSVAEEEGGRSLRRMFEVTVSLRDVEPNILRPGLSARVEVETRRIENATIVPRHAIDMSGEVPKLTSGAGTSREIDLIDCNQQDCAVELAGEDGVVER